MNRMADAAMRERFDAVVMLTASDWHAEPRSNRYHYATRFARILPVIFVQADRSGSGFSFEESGHEGVALLHVCTRYTIEQAQAIAAALAQRGIRRPLLWSYRGGYHQVLRFVYSPLRVYHATEDYYADEFRVQLPPKFYSDLEHYLAQADLVVAVSEGVRASYGRHCMPEKILVLENGCDDAFWKKHTRSSGSRTEVRQSKVAFYQGGINFRLDYTLIRDTAAAMPDWQFWFCGVRDPVDKDWKAITELGNVRDLGALPPEQVAAAAGQADVGIIPFIQTPFITEVSLPLKAFEYVACDLPVVSVPIRALEPWPEVFAFAAAAPDFATAIRRVAQLRDDPIAQERRAAIAASRDYDRRFEELLAAIATPRPDVAIRYKILVLYDARNTNDDPWQDILTGIGNFSRHTISFLMLSMDLSLRCDLSMFDAILVHDDPRQDSLSEAMAQALSTSGAYLILCVSVTRGDTMRAAHKLAQCAGHAVVQQLSEAAVAAQDFPGATLLSLQAGQSPAVVAAQLDAFLVARLSKAKPYIFVQELRAVLQDTAGDPAALEILRSFPATPPALSGLLTNLPVMPQVAARCMTAPFELLPGEVDNVLASLRSQILLRALLLRWFRAILRLLPVGARKAILRLLRPLAGWLGLL